MKALLIVVLLMMPCGILNASPYFRLIHQSPQLGLGTLYDPATMGQSQAAAMVPIITHSFNDGWLIIPGEDWSPLAIGGWKNGRDYGFLVGPTFNMLPVIQAGLLTLVTYLTPTDKYLNLKMMLLPIPTAGSDVSLSFSPTWEYQPIPNKGYFKIFMGPVWKF
jgi:hypothetical protein